MLLTLFIVVTLVFFLVRLVPGDPLSFMARKLPEQVKINFYAKYGLDKPLYIQYFVYLKNLFKGDMGVSLVSLGRDVKDMIKIAAPISAQINIVSLVYGVLVGIILGIIAAFNRNKWPDHLVMFIAVLGVSIPSFILATALQYLFTTKFMIFPTIGWNTSGGSNFKYAFLPVIALAGGSIAIYARYLRASVLEVLGQDYILTAKAKGVTGFQLVWKHVIRNAILPAITILGPQIAGIFVGSFVIESIFSIPGFGLVYIGAIQNRDFTMILGQTILLNGLFILSLFFVDILYGLVDPRIRVFKRRAK